MSEKPEALWCASHRLKPFAFAPKKLFRTRDAARAFLLTKKGKLGQWRVDRVTWGPES